MPFLAGSASQIRKAFPSGLRGAGTRTASHGASLPLFADKMVVHPSSAVTAHTHHEIRPFRISMSNFCVNVCVCNTYIRIHPKRKMEAQNFARERLCVCFASGVCVCVCVCVFCAYTVGTKNANRWLGGGSVNKGTQFVIVGEGVRCWAVLTCK